MAVSEVRLYFEDSKKDEELLSKIVNTKDYTVKRKLYYNEYEGDTKDRIIAWFANEYRNLAKDNKLLLEEYKNHNSDSLIEFEVKICESGMSVSSRTHFVCVLSSKLVKSNKGDESLDVKTGVFVDIKETLIIENNGKNDASGIKMKIDMEFDLDKITKYDIKRMSECIEDYLISYIAYDFVFRVKSKDQ